MLEERGAEKLQHSVRVIELSGGFRRLPFGLKFHRVVSDGYRVFTWHPSYSINVPVVDDQHRRLFEIAEQLHQAMIAGQGKPALSHILARLVTYTKTHFDTEERIMRECGYPGYERHKAEHVELTKKVLEFSRDYEAGRIALSVSVLQFLKDWLVNHIQGNDKKIATYVVKLPGKDPIGVR